MQLSAKTFTKGCCPLWKILDPPLDWGTLKTIINTGHDRSVLPEEFHLLYKEEPCCVHKDAQNRIHYSGKYLLEVNSLIILITVVVVIIIAAVIVVGFFVLLLLLLVFLLLLPLLL